MTRFCIIFPLSLSFPFYYILLSFFFCFRGKNAIVSIQILQGERESELHKKFYMSQAKLPLNSYIPVPSAYPVYSYPIYLSNEMSSVKE